MDFLEKSEIYLNKLDLCFEGEKNFQKILSFLVSYDKKKLKDFYYAMDSNRRYVTDYVTTFLLNDAQYIRYSPAEYTYDILEYLLKDNFHKINQSYEITGVINQYVIRTVLNFFLTNLIFCSKEDHLQNFLINYVKNDGELLTKKFKDLKPEKQLKLFLFLKRLIGKYDSKTMDFLKSFEVRDVSENNLNELLGEIVEIGIEKLKHKYSCRREYKNKNTKKKLSFLLGLYKNKEKSSYYKNYEMIKFLEDLSNNDCKILKQKYENLHPMYQYDVIKGLEFIIDENCLISENYNIKPEEWEKVVKESLINNGQTILDNYNYQQLNTKCLLNRNLNFLYDEEEKYKKCYDFLDHEINNIDYIYNRMLSFNEERNYDMNELEIKGEEKWNKLLNDLLEDNGKKIEKNYDTADFVEQSCLKRDMKNLLEFDGKKLIFYEPTDFNELDLLAKLLENECEKLKTNYSNLGLIGQYQMRIILEYLLRDQKKNFLFERYSCFWDYLGFFYV